MTSRPPNTFDKRGLFSLPTPLHCGKLLSDLLLAAPSAWPAPALVTFLLWEGDVLPRRCSGMGRSTKRGIVFPRSG